MKNVRINKKIVSETGENENSLIIFVADTMKDNISDIGFKKGFSIKNSYETKIKSSL